MEVQPHGTAWSLFSPTFPHNALPNRGLRLILRIQGLTHCATHMLLSQAIVLCGPFLPRLWAVVIGTFVSWVSYNSTHYKSEHLPMRSSGPPTPYLTHPRVPHVAQIFFHLYPDFERHSKGSVRPHCQYMAYELEYRRGKNDIGKDDVSSIPLLSVHVRGRQSKAVRIAEVLLADLCLPAGLLPSARYRVIPVAPRRPPRRLGHPLLCRVLHPHQAAAHG